MTGFLLFFFLQISAQNAYYTPPENFGGKEAFKDLIKTEMVYPKIARNKKEDGKVIVTATISSQAKVSGIHILQSAGVNLDREAGRLFDLLLWTPAVSKGKLIDKDVEVEFSFKLKKYLKAVKHRGYDQLKYFHTPIDTSLRVFETKQLDTLPRPIYPKEGMDFSEFMVRNMKYPAEAKKQGVAGTVELFFVIEPSGNITNLKVESGVGAGCSQEAMRLMKLLRWFPGTKAGKAVRTAIHLSITFNIDDSNDMRYVPSNNTNQI